MKLICNLLTLSLLALPSTMALRGSAAHRVLVETDNRSLGSNYEYKKYNGACRKHRDGTGSGNHGDEFHRYEYHDYPEMDKDWCKKKCSDAGSDCTAFEYLDRGDDSHCEIWEYQPKGYDEDRDDHYCYIKEYSDNDDDDDDDKEDEYDDYEHYEGACRIGSSSGKRGRDYTRYYRKNKDWCKEKCDDDDDCTGFEYHYKHGKKHCELWWSHISDWKSSDYFDCYVKKD